MRKPLIAICRKFLFQMPKKQRRNQAKPLISGSSRFSWHCRNRKEIPKPRPSSLSAESFSFKCRKSRKGIKPSHSSPAAVGFRDFATMGKKYESRAPHFNLQKVFLSNAEKAAKESSQAAHRQQLVFVTLPQWERNSKAVPLISYSAQWLRQILFASFPTVLCRRGRRR